MADFSVKMNGIDELNKKLAGLKYDVQKKGGRFALRKAAQVVRDQARANARALNDPSTPEFIASNITEKWNGRLNKTTGDLGFRIGVLGGARSTTRDAIRAEKKRRQSGVPSLASLGEFAGGGSGNPGGDTFYWRFLEFGTEKMAARPFMRPAIEQTAQKATDTFIVTFGSAIDRAISRAGK